jgi:hypothetical protein
MSDFTLPEDEDFFGAIGRLTISWAFIEFGLDLTTLVAYRDLGGSQFERDMPHALDRKITFLRKAFANLQPLAEYRERFLPLADKIKIAAETRHDLIHGVVLSQKFCSGTTVMMRLVRPVGERKPRLFATTTISVLRAAVEANKLGTQSLALGTDLQNKFSST